MRSIPGLHGLIILLSFLFSSAKGQTNPAALLRVPCAKFHNGVFEYTTGDRQGIRVVRKGHKQVETNLISGEVNEFKVKWTDDCVMQLTFKKSNMPTRYSQLAKGGRVVTQMDTLLITEDDFYEFKSMRFGVKNYSAARKILTKKEKKQRQKELEKKIREDSLAAQKAIQMAKDSVERDSINKVKAAENAEKEKKIREEAAKKKAEAAASGNAGGNPVSNEKPADKKGESKPGKEEKKPKEKTEKPAKEKKEKEEKPEKEKEEKPKEKPKKGE